ncbi:helix-turn-helix domain-containing protein [Hymenobacter sedentarius]|nr:helix-turn-helix domain-containing protein [Hymenobacter sedentarius]
MTRPLPAGITPSTFAKKAGEQPFHGFTKWLNLIIPLLEELDRYARLAAREEYELLLAEKAAAAVEADQNDQVLTVNEAAQLLGLSPQTVYEWVKAGKLQGFKAGREVRVKRGHVLAALKLQTQPNGRRKYGRCTTGRPRKAG